MSGRAGQDAGEDGLGSVGFLFPPTGGAKFWRLPKGKANHATARVLPRNQKFGSAVQLGQSDGISWRKMPLHTVERQVPGAGLISLTPRAWYQKPAAQAERIQDRRNRLPGAGEAERRAKGRPKSDGPLLVVCTANLGAAARLRAAAPVGEQDAKPVNRSVRRRRYPGRNAVQAG